MNDLPTRGMKRRTIANHLNKKLKEWTNTLPKELQQEAYNNAIVTGGAITSMLLGHMPNDYDIYFKNVDIAKKVAEHYLETVLNYTNDKVSRVEVVARENSVQIIIKSAGVLSSETNINEYEYFESMPQEELDKYVDKWAMKSDKPYKVAFISSNAISLTADIQIITRFVGAPEKIHKNYDFVHTTNYYTVEDGLVLNQPALESILAKELKYTGSLFPICSLFRIKKFIRRGWTISAGEILKIAYDINKLDLDDISVLQEQLIGVDAAYFHQVLSLIRQHTNSGQQLDRTYLFEAINRVFDSEEFL